MTSVYTHHRPSEWPQLDPDVVKLQWNHSVLTERDFLSTWQAQEHASTLAAEVGASDQVKVDVFTLPKFKPTSINRVRFNDEVTVLIGEDNELGLCSATIHHDSLRAFDDKPWRLRSRHPKEPQQDHDEASMMARRPTQPMSARYRDETSTTSSSSTSRSSGSSTSSQSDWRQTVLILLDGRMFPARLPWNDGAELVPQILRALDDQGQGIYGAHHVRHRPSDLIQQGLECLLIQTGLEPRPSTFVRIVLVDLEIFEPNEVLPGAFRRYAMWLPETINRVSVFRLLGLSSLLEAYPERSRLWYNNVLVDAGQVSPMYLQDGDYFQVKIGDHEDGFMCLNSSSTSFQENATDDIDDPSTIQTFTTSRTSLETSDVDPESILAKCISGSTPFVKSPTMCSMNEPYTHFSSTITSSDSDSGSLPPDRPPRVEQPIWYHEMWDLLRDHGAVEMAEEGPVLYVTSYYISHERVLSNTQTRYLRFDTDHETWEASVRFMWEDYIDNEVPFDLHIVSPNPSTTVFQGSAATVLITQHPVVDRVACVLTVKADDHFPQRLWHTARSTTTITPYREIIDDSGFGTICNVPAHMPQCSVWYGQQELPPELDVHVHDGLGLTIHVPAQPALATLPAASDELTRTVDPPDVDADDVMLLMQGLNVPESPSTQIDVNIAGENLLTEPKQHLPVCTLGLNLPHGHAEGNFYQRDTTTNEQSVPQWDPATPDQFLKEVDGVCLGR